MSVLTGTLARGVFSALSKTMEPRLSILIFHRVLPEADPLFPDEPDGERFDALISFVARAFRVMSFGEAVERLKRNDLPPRSLVVTFDDGYADNAEVAAPILRKHGIPATFFISSGFLDGGRMWNDTVIECIRRTDLPEIDLRSFGLGQSNLSDIAERARVIGCLQAKIKYLALSEREDALALLQSIANVSALPTNLMMRSEQVVEMHRSGMEIGGHTIHHPILAKISPAEAEREIANGRDALASIIGAPIQVFAYPNGKPEQDFRSEHVEIVRRLGFIGAASTAPGVARPGDDPCQLPRYTPWGRTLPVWATRLFRNQWNTGFVRV